MLFADLYRYHHILKNKNKNNISEKNQLHELTHFERIPKYKERAKMFFTTTKGLLFGSHQIIDELPSRLVFEA